MTRCGLTLVELLLALALLGLITTMGTASLRAASDRAALRVARAEVLRALDLARGAAVRLGEVVEFAAVDDQWVVQRESDHDAPIWSLGSGARRGVTLAGLGAPIAWGPHGLAVGAANRTLRLIKGSDTLAVVLSRLGRIR